MNKLRHEKLCTRLQTFLKKNYLNCHQFAMAAKITPQILQDFINTGYCTGYIADRVEKFLDNPSNLDNCKCYIRLEPDEISVLLNKIFRYEDKYNLSHIQFAKRVGINCSRIYKLNQYFCTKRTADIIEKFLEDNP